MSFLFILVTRFRKIFTETENAESAPYLFSLFYKKKKKSFVDIGSESGYTNNRPTCVFFFSQYETEFLFVVYFFRFDNLKSKVNLKVT